MPDTITLKTGDNETFTVSKDVAMQSETIKNMLEDTGTDTVPLPNVNAPTLSRIIEYCKFHHEKGQEGKSSEEIRKWDEEYVNVEHNQLFELILAANYLDIKTLLDLTCSTVAEMIKGKSPDEIRKLFNIKNDFTPEEEEEVKRENQWAFE